MFIFPSYYSVALKEEGMRGVLHLAVLGARNWRDWKIFMCCIYLKLVKLQKFLNLLSFFGFSINILTFTPILPTSQFQA